MTCVRRTCIHTEVHICYDMCGGQGSTLRSQFSPSTPSSRIKLRQPGLLLAESSNRPWSGAISVSLLADKHPEIFWCQLLLLKTFIRFLGIKTGCGVTYLWSQHLGSRSKRIKRSRVSLTAYWVRGQLRLHEALSWKKTKQNKNGEEAVGVGADL